MSDLDLNSLLAPAGGAGAVGIIGLLARAYLQRLVKDLEQLVMTVTQIKELIAGVLVRLSALEEQSKVVRIHDRKIAKLEGNFDDLDCQKSADCQHRRANH